MARITDFRVSFIWSETILDVVRGALAPADPALPSAVGREQYIVCFEAAGARGPPYPDPHPPWPEHRFQQFWWRYLEPTDPLDESLASRTGGVAWRRAVPVLLPAVLDVG